MATNQAAQDQPCVGTGYQVICIEADVEVTPEVTPQPPLVTCIGTTQVVPLGTHPCAPFTATCGFTIAQQVCVQVPVQFGATAQVTETRQQCGEATPTPCLPV